MAVSRNLKPIRNEYIQSIIGNRNYEGYDGELIVGAASGPLVYNRTNSGVMAAKGEPDFRYWVFDRWDCAALPYADRVLRIEILKHDPFVSFLQHDVIENPADLGAYEIEQLDAGYEGVMLRSINGIYKMGRSTPSEGILFKVKRFEDYEATVLSIAEAQENNNPKLVDHLGHAIRSKHQDNMVGKGMLGALLCKRESGEPFRVAPGTMTHADRIDYWRNPDRIVGKIIKVKSFAYGAVDQPRFARFHGLRDPIDA